MLLACRQWDPLGLARRLPSLGVWAWCCAPLLPWRVQCPVCVCAALAAGLGGLGRYLVLCLSRFPLPAPRALRCVWRALLSGCPLPSLAGTPFHAVCAFRALGPVALLVVPACPLRVCALALPRRPRPPLLGGVACAPRLVPALGAGRAVPRGPCPSACPAPVPCSVWRAWGGGGGPVPVFPYLAWVCGGSGRASPGGVPSTVARGVWGQALPLPRLPAHWAGCWGPLSTCCGRGRAGVGALLCPLGLHALWGLRAAGRVRGVRVPGGGLGGGGGVRRTPRLCGRGGPVGRGVTLPRFVPLPSLGRQQSGCHWRRAVHGGRGPPYHSGSCSPAFSGRDLCGVLAPWRGLACSPRPLWEPAAGAGGRVALRLLSRAGGGDHPPYLGGWGPGPPRLAGWLGGGGGLAPRSPCSPLGWRPADSILASLVSSAHSLPACACGRGRGAAPSWGGLRGGLWTAPPGAPADLNPPSALPEWAVVTGGSCRARPPYCSRAPPCAAPKLGVCVAPARCCGLALRRRPPREQAAGGAGARGVQVQAHPPPRFAVPSGGGGGGVPSAPGGRRAAPVAAKLEGGSRGGGVGGPPPRPPALSGIGLPSVVSGVPSRGTLVPWGLPGGGGRRARSGRPATGQCGGGGGGGGGTPPPWFAPPSSPGPASDMAAPFAPSLAPPVRRRPAAGRARGRLPRPWCPRTPGAAASSGGVRGRPFVGLPPSALGPEWEGGGEWGGPSGPLAPPPDVRGGGAHGGPGPGGQPSAWGSHPSSAPLYLEPHPHAGLHWGPSSPLPSSRGAGRPGAAVRVSGQRLAGCGAAGSPPRSLSPPSLPQEVARTPSSRRTVGGAWVGGPSSSPNFLASAVWAVTCAAACVGAGAVAAAGCAGGSASGRGRRARPGGASCWRPHS